MVEPLERKPLAGPGALSLYTQRRRTRYRP